MTTNNNKISQILNNQFGFSEFRAGQYEAICTLLEHDRLLCIQPTGHGKSLLYQLPSVLLDGITIVISPLLALMRDQISHLSTRFNIPAASINSDQNEEENYTARRLAKTGKLKILFIAPEQLDDIDRLQFLLSLPISLIVIDEAHCISTWGHDFRPSYRQIIQLVKKLEQKNSSLKVLALTATANHKTELDIQQQLTTLKPLQVHRSSMDRPNIELSSIRVSGLAEKLAIVLQSITELDGDGLIYCATRENTELVAEFCQNHNINAIAYHAGIDPNQKKFLQENFIHGKYKVIAATNALGMGIDKADLRFIIHFDFPGSITAYYQEIGRVGRDGLPSKAILLFDEHDKKIQHHFINSAQPSLADFQTILNAVSTSSEPPPLSIIKRVTGLHPTKVNVVVAELFEQNLFQKLKCRGRQCYKLTPKNSTPDLSRYSNQYKTRIKELEQMLSYGEKTSGCRMLTLRQTLGDENAVACNHCDLCKSDILTSNKPTEAINSWLITRDVKIKKTVKNKISEGIAILDGKLRSPQFVHFMRQRSITNTIDASLTLELLELLKSKLHILAAKETYAGVIVIPSRTWKAREAIATLIAQELNTNLFLNALTWRNIPAKRQGELLNNDQRRYNVEKKMGFNRSYNLPDGHLLLLDDYIGSGSTIKEASRVLRKQAAFTGKIVPFTIASVKWHLGKKGML